MEVEWLNLLNFSILSPNESWTTRTKTKRQESVSEGFRFSFFSFKKLLSVFRFDPEGSGSICAEEIRFIMKSLPLEVSDEEVDKMIRAVDKNKDGKIEFEEFKKMFESWKESKMKIQKLV